MNIVAFSKWTLGLLDFLVLLSIYATTEIRVEAGLLVLAIFLVRTLGVRIPSRTWMVILVLTILSFAVFVAFKLHIYPVLVAAHVGVVVHALLWLGKDEVRDRVLRLSMGFINLTLASALTTNFYLFGSIFMFAILGSIYISMSFLEATFRARLPEQLGKALPTGYLKNMVYISSSVFLISILLFPLIPRASWKRDDSSSYLYVGYNDTVDLLTAGQSSMRQSSRVALRILSQNPDVLEDPGAGIPMGMLKGQELDIFDGARWLPKVLKHGREVRIQTQNASLPVAQFEVIREPHLPAVVFRPYYSRVLEVGTERGRSHYIYRVGKATAPFEYVEAPDPADLMVPTTVLSQSLKTLAQTLFRGARNNGDRVRALRGYFRRGFTGTLEATQTAHSSRAILEDFLLRGKSGGCELFAASAATLLRLGGVPARVVAGYRVLRPSRSGFLTVLDNDAHAWVEYWEDARGWLPFDPTPKIYASPGFLDSLQESYWVAEGLWFRWFLNFHIEGEASPDAPLPGPKGEDSRSDWNKGFLTWGVQEFRENLGWAAIVVLTLILTLGARIVLRVLGLGDLKALLRPELSWSRRLLYLEYARFQRKTKRIDTTTSGLREIMSRWSEVYLRLRFGVPVPRQRFRESLIRLRELRKSL